MKKKFLFFLILHGTGITCNVKAAEYNQDSITAVGVVTTLAICALAYKRLNQETAFHARLIELEKGAKERCTQQLEKGKNQFDKNIHAINDNLSIIDKEITFINMKANYINERIVDTLTKSLGMHNQIKHQPILPLKAQILESLRITSTWLYNDRELFDKESDLIIRDIQSKMQVYQQRTHLEKSPLLSELEMVKEISEVNKILFLGKCGKIFNLLLTYDKEQDFCYEQLRNLHNHPEYFIPQKDSMRVTYLLENKKHNHKI